MIEQQGQRVEMQLRLLQARTCLADGKVRTAGRTAECPITGRATEQSTQRRSGEAGGTPSAPVEKRIYVSADPAADDRGLTDEEPVDSSISQIAQPSDLLPGCSRDHRRRRPGNGGGALIQPRPERVDGDHWAPGACRPCGCLDLDGNYLGGGGFDGSLHRK